MGTMKGRKVLVTGADGFIGSHLVQELLECGAEVRAFVYYNSFNSNGWIDTLPQDIRKNIEIFSGDIRDPYGVRKSLKDREVLFHLAALIGIPFSYHSPHLYVDTNVTGTLNFLQAARESSIKKIVHTSTSEVYGSAQFVPITEEHPLQAQSPYAASKIAADQLALSFFRSFEVPVSIIRPFNAYGPRQSARAVIPTIISQIAKGKKKVHIGSLHPTRDFTFVRDLTRAFVAIAEADKSVGEVINAGSNFEISIGETAKTIAELMGAQVELESEDARLRPAKSEVTRLWADNSKAKTIAGWTPRYGGVDGFKKGLQETIAWFSVEENLRNYKADTYNV